MRKSCGCTHVLIHVFSWMSLHGSFSKDDTHKRRDSGIHFHHVYMENPCESPGPFKAQRKGERCAPFPSHGSGASGSCSALTWRWIDRILAAWVNASVWVEDCNQLQYTSFAGGTPFGLAGFTGGTIAYNSLDSFLQ